MRTLLVTRGIVTFRGVASAMCSRLCAMSVWGPLEFGRGWQRIHTAVEAAMKADYTDQVVRPALGEWVDESMATTRGSSVLLLFIFQPFQKQLL